MYEWNYVNEDALAWISQTCKIGIKLAKRVPIEVLELIIEIGPKDLRGVEGD